MTDMQYNDRPGLPRPDALSAEHSACVAGFIRERIAAAGGSISFAEFMQHALYAPGLGYYSAGSTKFGKHGDFITAPEVSAVFGRVLARQCAETLRDLPGSAVLEYGAGTGKLAADVLSALAELDALPTRYDILEVSADLRERQREFLQEKVPDLAPLVTWLNRAPGDFQGVIIANEVLDALPVERFRRTTDAILQLRVAIQDGAFIVVETVAPEKLSNAVFAIEEDIGRRLPKGFVSEISPGLPGWVSGLAHTLQRGMAFLFDYGVARHEYYAAERSDGWLRCHYRHHVHDDALILPGIQDLTAWIDFTAVAEAAIASGLEVAGYTTQAQFLMNGGLELELEDFAALPTESQLALSGEVKMLTLPGEMGEHFKCMALRCGEVTVPSAFGLADRAHTL